MSGGLNRGVKYTLNHTVRESSNTKEGVSFGEKSNKWLVRVKNETQSKSCRPFVVVAQFDKKEDAEEYYKLIKD